MLSFLLFKGHKMSVFYRGCVLTLVIDLSSTTYVKKTMKKKYSYKNTLIKAIFNLCLKALSYYSKTLLNVTPDNV